MLHERDARRGELVRACSESAVARGILPGMPLAEAAALLRDAAKSSTTGAPGSDRAVVSGQNCLRTPDKTGTGSRLSPPTPRSLHHVRVPVPVLSGPLNDDSKITSALQFDRLTPSPTGCASRSPRGPLALRLSEEAVVERCLSAAPPPRTEAPYFARHEADRDREALLQLALRCEQFSPIVGLDQGDQPDGLRMDIRGLAMLFGGERSLAWRVVEFFQQVGYRVRVSIADTPAAAAALARWSDVTGPCVIAMPGDQTALANLPVAALRLPEAVEQQLQHLGIYRLGPLQSLPRGSLAARFGPQPLERLDRITGAAEEVIVACHPPADLTVRRCFEHPVAHPEAIELVVQQLLQQLSRRLIVQGMGVLQLECQLICQNRMTREMRIGLFQPTVDPGHLMALICMQLERLELPEALQEIRIAAVSTAVREQRQGELFADATPGDPAKLAWLIERLSNRLGCERVLRPELQADALVERAFCCRPLTGERSPRDGAAVTASSLSTPGPMFRPLRLFDPPRPIDVVGIALDGPPAKFFYQRQAYRIARSFGPERIETGWWRGPSMRRDYYRVETTAGNRLWLFRQLQDQQWFLHGEFE